MYQGEKSNVVREKARKEEGGAEGAEAREAETTVSLFMGFTGVRSTARAAEGTAPLRTRAWQVLLPSVNRGRRYCLLSRRQPILPSIRSRILLARGRIPHHLLPRKQRALEQWPLLKGS